VVRNTDERWLWLKPPVCDCWVGEGIFVKQHELHQRWDKTLTDEIEKSFIAASFPTDNVGKVMNIYYVVYYLNKYQVVS
jgi:hypothetical protein